MTKQQMCRAAEIKKLLDQLERDFYGLSGLQWEGAKIVPTPYSRKSKQFNLPKAGYKEVATVVLGVYAREIAKLKEELDRL